MNRLLSWGMTAVVVLLTAASLLAFSPGASKTKGPVHDLSLDEDTVNSLTIRVEGSSVLLRWHRQAEAIECFVVRAFQTNLADAETLLATPDTIWLDNTVLAEHNRAFYWIIPRFMQSQPHDTDQIEDFDGTVDFTSYDGQDMEPDGYSFPTGGTINPGGHVLELSGNTWKTEAISPVTLHRGSVWRVAVKFLRRGELAAFGVADSADEMWYTLDGSEQRVGEGWIQTYQSWFGDSVWVWLEFQIGDDWYSHFGYDPNIDALLFANDNDGSNSNGKWQIDEILDVTHAISLPPEAGFTWEIQSYTGDSMDVRFRPYNYDPEAPLAYVQWIFGDGTFSYDPAPVHRYLRQRIYAATCVVADSAGQLDWAKRDVADSTYSGSREFSVLFTGDVMMGRRYESEGLIPNEGVDSIFGRMQPIISAADFAECNLETSITDDSIQHPTKSIVFKSAPYTAGGLAFAGFDLCASANNHILDYMVDGMHDTKQILDSLGILSVGTGDYEEMARAPVFLTKNGLCVAVLSFCNRDGTDGNEQPFLAAGPSRPGFAFWDRAAIEEMIPRVRDVADLVVVLVHSGIEYATIPPYLQVGRPPSGDPEEPILELLPDTSDVELRRYAIDMGADLIINTHPHVIQGCEVYNGKVIAHSLGNFAFDQTYPETFITFTLEARFSYESGVDQFILHPVYIDRYIPTPATGELGQGILDYEAELSRPMGTWIVREPDADTARILVDTNLVHFPHYYTDTLQMVAVDTFTTSAPFRLAGEGYPVQVTSPTPNVQIRLGREIAMVGNMESEGANLWNLNSSYEQYDTVAHRGARSIKLHRGGGGTNSVSTALLYRPAFNPSWNASIMGWLQTQNARDARIQLEYWDSRSGGNQVGLWTISNVAGDLPWTQFWQDVDAVQDAWYFNLTLSMRAPTSGTGQARYDDVMLVRWDDFQSSPANAPFPNSRTYVQVRGPLGLSQVVITYRRDTMQ